MARIKGNSITKEFRPEVKLVSANTDPVGTLAALWIGSRYEHPVSASDLQHLYEGDIDDGVNKASDYIKECYPEYASEGGKAVLERLVQMVLDSGLPPLDSLNFTFEIDHANVAWREQLVRGRLPQNFWMQTSRTADLTTIDVNRSVAIDEKGEEAVKIYNDTVDTIRNAYKALVELGVPTEEIRLAPQGMLHRVYWMVNYRTLKSTINRRMSWIAQASLWSPIINDIQVELRRYCPLLANDLGRPADVIIKGGLVIGHTYDNENEDRYYGRDYQPCDPLWLAYRGYTMPEHTDIEFYDKMKSIYINLWSDDILDILGWDRHNPSKLGRYDRPVK